MPFIRLIIFSNLFVSLCVVALTWRTFAYLQIKTSIPLLVLVFLATYFIYNFQRLFRLSKNLMVHQELGNRMKWFARHSKIISISLGFAALGMLIVLWWIEIRVVILLIVLGVLSVLYVVSFMPFRQQWWSFRAIPYLKIFIIGALWTGVTAFLPLINEYDSYEFNNEKILFILKQFLFVVAITLPFDIRDMHYDSHNEINTIPLKFGKNNTVVFGGVLLFVFIMISAYEWLVLTQISFAVFISEVVAIIVTTVLLVFSKKQQPELYYSFGIEATSLLLAATVLFN